jgi:hypothetical protein
MRIGLFCCLSMVSELSKGSQMEYRHAVNTSTILVIIHTTSHSVRACKRYVMSWPSILVLIVYFVAQMG